MKEEKAWSTDAEIDFIYKIGTFTKQKISIDELRRRYAKACEKRVNWDRIDKEESLTHLKQLIA